MHLSQLEQEKQLPHVAAQLARACQARGLQLNYLEAMAILTAEIMEGARDGRRLRLLGRTHVEETLAGIELLSPAPGSVAASWNPPRRSCRLS